MLWATAAGAGWTQVVVLTSIGPSETAYPSGAVLRANTRVSLLRGDRLEVVDSSGSHVVSGPRIIAVNQIDEATKRELARPLPPPRRLGVPRATNDVAAARRFALSPTDMPPTLWQIPVGAAPASARTDVRDVCRLEGQPAILWRGSRAPARLELADTAGHKIKELAWPAGEQTLRLIDDAMPTVGETYIVTLEYGPPERLRWTLLPAHPTGLADLARALAKAGCQEQLGILVERTDG